MVILLKLSESTLNRTKGSESWVIGGVFVFGYPQVVQAGAVGDPNVPSIACFAGMLKLEAAVETPPAVLIKEAAGPAPVVVFTVAPGESTDHCAKRTPSIQVGGAGVLETVRSAVGLRVVW